MHLRLALISLARHRARTGLAVLGVAVAAAMLLDMVMLSSGMRESFGTLLESRGFSIRLAPRGTLPFDTEATIAGASEIVAVLSRNPDIAAVSPVLGATVHVVDGARQGTAFALGVDVTVQGDYEVERGGEASRGDSFVANEEFVQATGAQLGDTLTLATAYSPQLRSYSGERRVVLTGIARFLYMSRGQSAVGLPLTTLQAMGGVERRDRASLFMVGVREGAIADTVQRWIERAIPRVDAISTREALARVDERLAYFRQMALILGGVSLLVGFLLVTTLVTVSVNQRVGEIAVQRAIGISRGHVVQQIVVESLVISALGASLGLALGLVTARWLNAILASFPGLPTAIDFFLFQPRAAWTALALLVLSGILAGVYPSWRAASLPIARTLREEAVA
ncbi:MAG TPA: FtsX-like permease family protein [Gemmatimonadaceae bacterium]|nr:FtsX-like permease family protein [Gemmatimonadaceae bacterium]